MSRHLGFVDLTAGRATTAPTGTGDLHSHCSQPDKPGIAAAEDGGPVVRAKADNAALPVTAPTPGAEGHSRTHSPDAGTVVPAKPATAP